MTNPLNKFMLIFSNKNNKKIENITKAALKIFTLRRV